MKHVSAASTGMKYLAIDQYGQHHPLVTSHPRKELMGRLCRRHCAKMYADQEDGSSAHVGYVIGGLWLRVFGVEGRVFARAA